MVVIEADDFFNRLLKQSSLGERSKGTIGQYRRTIRWYWSSWVIPADRLPLDRSEVQLFLDSERCVAANNNRHGCVLLHHRVLQSIANRFWVPQLSGPPIVLLMRKGDHPGRGEVITTTPFPTRDWTYFVPRYILNNHSVFTEHQRTLSAYVCSCAPSPTDVGNIRYQLSILFRWVLVKVPSLLQVRPDTAVMEKNLIAAVLARALHAKCPPNKAEYIIQETVRVINRLLLGLGITVTVCSRVVKNLYRSSISCDRLITSNTIRTNIAKANFPCTVQDAFSQVDITRLISDASTAFDRCIFLLMSQIGLRRRAVAWLRLAAVWNGQQVLTEGWAVEKGTRLRVFTINDTLAQCLYIYITRQRQCASGSPWLFPSPRDPGAHIRPGTLALRLKKHCTRLKIIGSHTHPHAIRKFVVNQLLQVGNSVESVSAWLGHANIDTTYGVYWVPSLREISCGMNIPWLSESRRDSND